MTLKRVRNRRGDLSHVQWQDMERLLAMHYRQAGYDVEHVGTAGSDPHEAVGAYAPNTPEM